MATAPMIPMIAPDGTSGDIPQDKVAAATQAGFKQAVEMKAPSGQTGYIPVDRQQDALKAGFGWTNPKGEGTYKMVGRQGPVSIPYSNVRTARANGYLFSGNDGQRFAH